MALNHILLQCFFPLFQKSWTENLYNPVLNFALYRVLSLIPCLSVRLPPTPCLPCKKKRFCFEGTYWQKLNWLTQLPPKSPLSSWFTTSCGITDSCLIFTFSLSVFLQSVQRCSLKVQCDDLFCSITKVINQWSCCLMRSSNDLKVVLQFYFWSVGHLKCSWTALHDHVSYLLLLQAFLKQSQINLT